MDKDKIKNILISFSGGQTSAYMLKWILDNHKEANIKVVFANTGQEHLETYKFIQQVGEYFKIQIDWIECVLPEDRNVPTGFKIVSPTTYKTDGSLFEQVVRRYGIPNIVAPICTRELKIYPLQKYAKSFWKNDYHTAIGIRADEIDRINPKYEKIKYYYPLAWNGITKEMINKFWDEQPFKLNIPNYLGNCVWCWKKSFNKLNKIINENPSYFDVPRYLEEKYPINNIPSQKARFGKPQTFFRSNLSAKDLIEKYNQRDLFDLEKKDKEDGYENSCQESCEVY